MFEALSYQFMQNAVIAAVLVSFTAGVIGSLIVVNRMVFLAGGIAHAAYGGVGLALFSGISITLGTTIFSIISALFMFYVSFYRREKIDVFIGLIWAVGMAIGIILVDVTPGYNVDLMSYLFGSILAVNTSDLYYTATLLLSIIAILSFWYRDILAVSYDSEYASLVGVNVKFFYFLILLLTALSVVVTIKVVGLILVIALLTIPVYIAQQLSNSLLSMMFISGSIATLFSLTGLYLSYNFNLTSGASIILTAAVGLMLFMLFERKK